MATRNAGMTLTSVGLYVQEACHSHRYIRTRDDSSIVERPERLRSVAVGVAAALSRLEEVDGARSFDERGRVPLGDSTPINTSTNTNTNTNTGNGTSDSTENSGDTASQGVGKEDHVPSSIVSNSGSETSVVSVVGNGNGNGTDTDELTGALDRLSLAINAGAVKGDVTSGLQKPEPLSSRMKIIRSNARVSLLDDEAVKYIHGDIDGPGYIHKFVEWASQSADKISRGESEIPAGLHQVDLYLCPESQDAVSGALGTVCEAVDSVINSSRRDIGTQCSPEEAQSQSTHTHAFVSVRPPGHHCGEDTPCGFCFVNNVMVGAAHAHLEHKINRVVIFDIDLHHGNGTQSIVWNINEEAYREEVEVEAESHEQVEGEEAKETSSGDRKKNLSKLKVFYGSLHDVMSFPCEDGKMELIQAASTSLRGPHGQWIENIHLLPYESEEEFYATLYPHYSQLIRRAEEYVQEACEGDEVLVFISAGFDASLHEHPYMSRHGRKVPTSFYYKFTKDVIDFAAKYAKSRVVSVLEGGYSSRALSSGAFAHVIGLADVPVDKVSEEWWSLDHLIKLERATKQFTRRTSHSASASAAFNEHWIHRTLAFLSELDVTPPPSKNKRGTSAPVVPFERMTLRERKKKVDNKDDPAQSWAAASVPSTILTSPTKKSQPHKELNTGSGEGVTSIVKVDPEGGNNDDSESVVASVGGSGFGRVKKVTLHVKPPSQRGGD